MNTVLRRVQRRSRQPSRQRGAAAIIAAFALLLLVPVLALALNIGQLYYAQRDLNKQATLAALSAVQVSSGCANGGVPAQLAAVRAEVQRVIAENNGNDKAAALAVMTGINGSKDVELGTVQTSTGRRIFVPLPARDGNVTAVRVNLSRPQPVPFINLYGASGGLLYASATAEQPAVSSFRLGATTLALNDGALNSLLGGLLGTNVNLTAVGYQGLAQARVTLADLLVAANVGTLQDLLDLDLTVPQSLQIVADALAGGGDATSGAAAGLIGGLAGQNFTGGNDTVQNIFGEIFNNLGSGLNPTATDVVSAIPFIDGLGLLSALGQAASNGESILLPLPLLNIPGLTGVGVFVKILEPEQPSNLPGRAGDDPDGNPYTTARSSQLVLQTRMNLNVGLLQLVRLAIDINVGNGVAELKTVSCPTSGSPNSRASIQTTTSLITGKLGTFPANRDATDPPTDPIAGPAALLGLVTVGRVGTNGEIRGTTHAPQTATGPNFSIPLPLLSSDGNLTTLINSLLADADLRVIGLPLGTLISRLLMPITALVDALLDPLLATLGVSLGEAGVTVDSIETPRPTIVTNCIPGTALCPNT